MIQYRVLQIIGLLTIILMGCSDIYLSSEYPSTSLIEDRSHELRPDFISNLSPAENQTILLDTFNDPQNVPGYGADIWDNISGYGSQICMKLEVSVLAENGDNFIDNNLIHHRIKASHNGEEATLISVNDILSQSLHIMNNEGDFIKIGVAPRIVCIHIEPEIGVNLIEFEFQKTSGDLETYQWQFEIIP